MSAVLPPVNLPNLNQWKSTFQLQRIDVTLRALRENDAPHLEWHGGEDLRAFYQQQWELHHQQQIFVVVADFNGFPIAQAAIHWHGKPTQPHIPDVQSVRVMPPFRKQKIGTQLIKSCESLAHQSNFEKMGLSVAVTNTKAFQLYSKLGYEIVGNEYVDQWHYVNALGQTVHVKEKVLDLVKKL